MVWKCCAPELSQGGWSVENSPVEVSVGAFQGQKEKPVVFQTHAEECSCRHCLRSPFALSVVSPLLYQIVS